MTFKKTVSLFDGEFVVSPSGIYTFAHFYRHYTRSVVLVGTNHVGDETYYQRIRNILFQCDLVLFEGKGGDSGNSDEFLNQSKPVLFGEDLGQAFGVALPFYFLSATKILGLPLENVSFDFKQPHWVSGEAPSMAVVQMQEIPSARRQAVVGFVRRSIKKMEKGEFGPRDFGEGFVFFWSDPLLVEVISNALGKPRDLYLMRMFDSLVAEQDPSFVGIKFGAGHTTSLRKLLEQRGYVLKNSERLCNIRF